MTKAIRKRRLWIAASGLSVLGVLVLAFMCAGALWWVSGWNGRNWTQDEIEQSQQIGNGIISAIEAYRISEGTYPETLEHLIPDYIDSVPMPVAGTKEWEYMRFQDDGAGESFQLEFPSNASRYPTCYFVSGRRWYVDD